MTVEENKLQQKDIQNLTSNLGKLEQAMTLGFNKVNDRLDLMNDHFIRKDFFEDKIKYLNEDIAELKDSNKWMFRTVASLILGIIISGLIFIK
jgi:hypothetical protein